MPFLIAKHGIPPIKSLVNGSWPHSSPPGQVIENGYQPGTIFKFSNDSLHTWKNGYCFRRLEWPRTFDTILECLSPITDGVGVIIDKFSESDITKIYRPSCVLGALMDLGKITEQDIILALEAIKSGECSRADIKHLISDM